MGEYRVHNVRFYDFKPEAINCITYNENQAKLALSRADNSIEIWDLSKNIFQEKIIPSSADRSIESLKWASNRLFSTGFHGDLTEYDLLRLCPKKSVYVAPSACMDVNSAITHIAIGTEEGHVCLFDIELEAQFERSFKQEGRILCLAWHCSGDFIVTGSVDVLRIWSVTTGYPIQTILVGRNIKAKETIVWCVLFTRDFQVISGDSRGKVCFWNGKLGTQLDSIQSHKGDVLALCINKKENEVCASGVDPKIISFQLVFKRGEKERANWIRCGERKPHSHDTRALTFANYFLVSGGVDSYLNVIRYPEESRSLHSPLPQCPTVQVAKKTNILLLRYPTHLELWTLGKMNEESIDGSDGSLRKLVDLKAKENETIVCCSLSTDSQWLAYSTTTQLRLFQVIMENLEDKAQISLLRVRYIPPGCFPCHRMQFTPDSSQLVVASNEGIIHVLSVDNIQPGLLHCFVPPTDLRDCIHLLTISNDGEYLATGDHLGNIFVYNLKKGEFHCALPKNMSQPSAMAFHPKSSNLVVAYCNLKLVEFDIGQQEFTNWTRIVERVGNRLRARYPVLNISFDPAQDDVIILHDDNRICIVNKGEVAQCDVVGYKSKEGSKKNAKLQGFHCCYKYKHLLYFGTLQRKGEVLAVEVSVLSLFESLPPLLAVKKFGT